MNELNTTAQDAVAALVKARHATELVDALPVNNPAAGARRKRLLAAFAEIQRTLEDILRDEVPEPEEEDSARA